MAKPPYALRPHLQKVEQDLKELKAGVNKLHASMAASGFRQDQHSRTDEVLLSRITHLENQLESVQRRLLAGQGAILKTLKRQPTDLHDAEFRVFSQWGEDGIISYLIDNLEIANHTFIEFGVEDFSEANCRFLLEDRNWSGYVLDGSPDNVARLVGWGEFWKYSLRARAAFITRDNVAGLLAESGFNQDLGILSIDLDGVDYWIASELTTWRPRILVMEYNAVFGKDRAITIPYSDGFERTKAHHSNLYWGASLKALVVLASRWGYGLVGTNSAGCNAFFVRRDLLNERIRERPLVEAFTDSKYRESRDTAGRLDFLSGAARLKAIAGLPVVNVETGAIEKL